MSVDFYVIRKYSESREMASVYRFRGKNVVKIGVEKSEIQTP